MSKHIEQQAHVYLHRDVGSHFWEVDPVTFDSGALEGLRNGDSALQGFDPPDDMTEEQYELLEHAVEFDLNEVGGPDGDELLKLMIECRYRPDVNQLLAAYWDWDTRAGAIGEKEERGENVNPSEFERIDDEARDLARRLGSMLERMLGA